MNAATAFTPSLRQLRAFRAVFHLRKLSAAAEQLSITQSAVSVLIRQLEDGLGTRLFDRTTRSLRPTPAAAEAIAVAERILRDVDSLGAGLRDLGALRRGRVSVAVTPTLGEILLPAVVRRFTKQHPEIQVLVDDCSPEQFVSRVVGEHVDLGIGTPERAAADVDTRKLLGDTLAFVCRKDHPLAARRQVRWADLVRQPVITVRPGYGIRPLIDGAAAQAGVQLDVVNDVTFLSTALWMVECGLGGAVMPSAYALGSGRTGLAVRKLHAPVVSRDIYLVTKRGRSLSPAAQALAVVIEGELGRKNEHS
ncbi:LysR family transcriptional regulator [Ramlibacter sp. USB13]|uniref:LysR family transcriptional regulator n=1 Tax=Ramlibacter cellulosilyticus TaxID=2764187 RepID=A0A923MUV8_9BURK|nr:LysR family transcriptional regulator [Ramlibacter cellulosilyticus]MBC5784609.1 LysR family transcriptional regulator [Ramlibacter cellulosilyticus]